MGEGKLGRYCEQAKSDGSFKMWKKWWRKKEKNYPKCVPIAKARAMTKGQSGGCRKKKRAKANTGPKPTRAATFAPKEKSCKRWINR